MYIAPAEYLNLSQRISSLNKQCEELHLQNLKLKDDIIRQSETINFLNEQKQRSLARERQTKFKLAQHITSTSELLRSHMETMAQQQRKFIEDQMIELSQDSAAKKLKLLEDKMQKDRIIYQQYIEFYGKIKTLYHSCTKKKETPSLQGLFKWIQEGRQHEIVGNDLSKGILQFMLGGTKKAANGLRESSNKVSSKNIPKSTKKLNESSAGMKTKQQIQKGASFDKNGAQRNNAKNQEKENQNSSFIVPLGGGGFLQGIIAAAKAKKQEPLQPSNNTQNNNQSQTIAISDVQLVY